MKIGFDAKRAFLNASGLGNYSRQLVNSLAEFFPQHEYLLFTPKRSNLFGKNGIEEQLKVIEPRGVWKTFRAVWRSTRIISDLRRNKVELYHGLSNELPIGISKSKIKSVVTIHDLIFLRHPEYYPAADRNIYHRKSKRACTEADHIIAVSERTKYDIMEFYRIPEEKISVLHQGIHPSFFVKENEEQLNAVRKKYSLPDQFILYVGTIEERKNLDAVINALPKISSAEDIKMVVVGKATSYKQKVEASIQHNHLEERVLFLQNVPSEDLPAIYQCAILFVYPSKYEGFGLPVVEAQASGVPVVTGTKEIFLDAGGNAAVYCSEQELTSMVKPLQGGLFNNELRSALIENGYRHAENFRPQKQAHALIELYERLLQKGV